VESWGLMQFLDPLTLRISGHFVDIERDAEGVVSAWRLRCGGCLSPGDRMAVAPPARSRPGLPVDGALRLPRQANWPAVTLAWGIVGSCCDHGSVPDRPPTGGTRSRNRVLFERAWATSVESDPVLVAGALWLSVAPVHARRVRTEAFGVRQRACRTEPSWDPCPA
jgi:hypothetical protein